LAGTDWWKGRDARSAALFQMDAKLLCMPMDEFHRIMEEALGRPVYTHEFGLNWDGLKRELLGEAEAPSFDEIVALLPASKTIIVDEL
jgi:hypothetical protein